MSRGAWGGWTARQSRAELQGWPLSTMLLYAFGETRDEFRAPLGEKPNYKVDPLVVVLDTIGTMIDAYLDKRAPVRVSLADLRKLARLVDVAREIMRRSKDAPPASTPRPSR